LFIHTIFTARIKHYSKKLLSISSFHVFCELVVVEIQMYKKTFPKN